MYSDGSSHDQNEAADSLEADDYMLPEHKSMISITSYDEMREIIENFINSKRRARDAENNYHFLKAGPKSNCARIDAVYHVRAGVTGHIKVQDKDQYWAEEERKFPHLKEIHLEEEMMNTIQAVNKSSASESHESSRLHSSSAHPSRKPETSTKGREYSPLVPPKEVVALKSTRKCSRSVPGTQLKGGKPPKKARLEKHGNPMTYC